MAASTRVTRQAKAAASQRAAKERRERIMIVGLAAVLVIVLAIELPKVLKSSSSSSSSSAPPAAPVTSVPGSTAPASAKTTSKALRVALNQPPHDVFATRTAGTPSAIGNVPVPAGRHDPFATPGSAAAAVAPPVPKPKTVASTLPGTIIIGTPGKGRVAVKGWIVILASIPTGEGEGVAKTFAATARKQSLGTVSILNSSNRRPLRGGYWVVYVGPYNTLGAVAGAAGRVHGAGFGTAYIRELIVYKKK
jgi:hypothetical protein